MKTNAARILDRLGMSYELREYAVDEDDLGAASVAAKVGMPAGQVFKTLVARGDKSGVLLACIPGSAELDLKALAAASGNKRIELVQLKEVQPLTGYVRGGVSPIGTKKSYPVYLDASAADWPKVSVSAGVRGCQIILDPAELVLAVAAKACSISRVQ